MGSITGIELGPDSCVLVRARRGRARAVEVLALHTIERAGWPSQDVLLIAALRDVRRTLKLPRRARVVVWELREGSTLGDREAVALLRPLTAAGFRVDALLSPPEALARVAASRPRPSATQPAVWAAVNVHGVAIAVVRGEDLLFSRTLEWSYTPALSGSRAQLLQRYSLVAQLASEIRHAIVSASLPSGESVATVIMCGDIPELRSLTMPLIEELDLEVETLDSSDGMQAVGRATRERFAESAPAIRLACAAALSTPASSGARFRHWASVAAGIAVVAALGWGIRVYRDYRDSDSSAAAPTLPPSGFPSPGSRPGSGAAASPGTPHAAPPPRVVENASALPISTMGQSPARPSTQSSPGARGPGVTAPEPLGGNRAGPPSGGLRSVPPPAPIGPAAQGSAASVSKPVRSAPAPVKGTGTPVAAHPTPSSPGAPSGQAAPRRDLPAAGAHVQAGRHSRAQERLAEPLPRLDSILVDQDRRLAIVDGAVVKIGDTVGSRVVVQIERDAVVLREPSGVTVRVPLRAKSS